MDHRISGGSPDYQEILDMRLGLGNRRRDYENKLFVVVQMMFTCFGLVSGFKQRYLRWFAVREPPVLVPYIMLP